jgi:hypothetical protein
MTNIFEGFTRIGVLGISVPHSMKSLGSENVSLSHTDLPVSYLNLTSLSLTGPECDMTKLRMLKHLTKFCLLSVSFHAARELIWDRGKKLVCLETD